MNEEPKKIKKAGYRIRLLTNTVSYVMLILGISLILSTVLILVVNDAFALAKEGEHTITVETAIPLTAREMGVLLKENEIIRFPWAFDLFVKVKTTAPEEKAAAEAGEDLNIVKKILARLGNAVTFDEGSYDLIPTMDYGQIIDTLRDEVVVTGTVRITFPEGYTIRQIGALLEENKVCSQEDFINTCNTYNFSHEFLKNVPTVENRLEGYMYPDTYDFYLGESSISAANRFLNNFNKRYTDAMRDLTEDSKRTIEEIVIIASLIEKEAKLNAERSRIGGVIYNRLNKPSAFPCLQIDATVLYALGKEGTLTAEDLLTVSPYNTYTTPGLPPTAICNPGISSMLAALQYEDHGYYYYVADPEDGSHLFAKTLEQHNKNVAAMEQKAKELAAGGAVG